jgi:hypothetical protein
VETNLAQGTREAHSAYQITNWPLQAFYVARYVQDLNRRQPAWFVDAVGTGSFIYGSRDKFAHENTPALKAAVESQYELLAEFDFMRIYHLKKSAKD